MRRLLSILVILSLYVSVQGQAIIHLTGTKATLECYDATNPQAAVVVCPGGSYSWLDYKVEGVEVAQWLQAHGISAYVLRYRVQGWWAWATHYRLIFRGHRYPDPLYDAEAALDWLQSNASGACVHESADGLSCCSRRQFPYRNYGVFRRRTPGYAKHIHTPTSFRGSRIPRSNYAT